MTTIDEIIWMGKLHTKFPRLFRLPIIVLESIFQEVLLVKYEKELRLAGI